MMVRINDGHLTDSHKFVRAMHLFGPLLSYSLESVD